MAKQQEKWNPYAAAVLIALIAAVVVTVLYAPDDRFELLLGGEAIGGVVLMYWLDKKKRPVQSGQGEED